MAVLKSKRGESGVQFLETAYALEVFTIKQALKFPKRYTFLVTTEIVRLASDCHTHAKMANSIYPTTAHEAQLRRDQLILANNAIQALLSKLDIAKGLFVIETDVLRRWIELVVSEASLLAAVKKSDRKRFSELV